MKTNKHTNKTNTFGLDIGYAGELLRAEQYGSWHRDPWNFPELDSSFLKDVNSGSLKLINDDRRIDFAVPPNFLPFDFPKNYWATRPAVTQDIQSSLTFTASALRIGPRLHSKLEDWVYGWRFRGDKYTNNNSSEWEQYTRTKTDIANSVQSAQTDITSCFASIDNRAIMDLIYSEIGATAPATLIESVLKQHELTPGRRGLPQRSTAASIIAQLAFHYIDNRINEGLVSHRISSARRWMDDISFEGPHSELHRLLIDLQNDARRFGLEINASKTHIRQSQDIIKDIENEDGKLITVQQIDVPDEYSGSVWTYYDDSALRELESAILEEPIRHDRATIGRVLRSLQYYDLFDNASRWASAAPFLPHAADRLGRYLLEAHHSGNHDVNLSQWATASISSEYVALPWVQAQFAITVPSSEIDNDLKNILWGWIAPGATLQCLAVAADRLSRLEPKLFNARVSSIIDQDPGPQRDRVLALAMLVSDAPRNRVRNLIRRNPSNNITALYLDKTNWRTPRTVSDFDRDIDS